MEAGGEGMGLRCRKEGVVMFIPSAIYIVYLLLYRCIKLGIGQYSNILNPSSLIAHHLI